ncbi:MAG: glycoside hydrolase family 127 protein, partial [Oscillospiraceae bacterium]|nr:glycoside hydrolase family 127 protein [Oscillospiraceae bacterium]
EVDPKRILSDPNLSHVKPVRQKWFDCSCCPTNIARTIMGLGGYAYGTTDDSLYVNLYCQGSAKDGERNLSIITGYPYKDTAEITASGGKFKLCLRNPENSPVISLELNGKKQDFKTENGYIVLKEEWNNDRIKLTFHMAPHLIYCTTELQNNIGKAAIMRGPIVYCMEEVDNSRLLGAYILPKDIKFSESSVPDGLPEETIVLEAAAFKYNNVGEDLYTTVPPIKEQTTAKLIPYFLWANRGENEMRVFLAT